MSTLPPSLAAAALLALAPRAVAPDDDPAPTFELPPGPVATYVGTLGADCPADGALLPWPHVASPHWMQSDPWLRWVQAVKRAARGGEDGARARAELAALAAVQGRHEAAWDHLAALVQAEGAGDVSPLVSAVLPSLLPGAAGQPVGAGALHAALPDDALLLPAVPPTIPEGIVDEHGFPPRRRMSVRGVRVGEATLALTVQLDPDGVQVDLSHLEGGPCRVRLRIPDAPGLTTQIEYVDWIRQDDVGTVHRVELAPGGDPVSLWARALPTEVDHPVALPDVMPARIAEAGLAMELEERDPNQVRLALLLDALGALLEVPVEARVRGEDDPPEGATPADGTAGPIRPVLLRLPQGDDQERKAMEILTLAERWVLDASR